MNKSKSRNLTEILIILLIISVSFVKFYDFDKPNGSFKKYHENGAIKETLTYKRGVMVGLHEKFYPDGKLKCSIVYDMKGKKNGTQKSYFENGYTKSIKKYNHGAKTGQSISHYSNGKIKAIKEYNDKGTILSDIKYHENGKNKLISSYKNGVKDGSYTEYYDNGQVKKEAIYAKGKIKGDCNKYYQKGQIKSQIKYIQGKKAGEVIKYYENGNIKYSGSYRKGIKTGEHKYFYENGNLKKSIPYVKGKIHGEVIKKHDNEVIKTQFVMKKDKLYSVQKIYNKKQLLEKIITPINFKKQIYAHTEFHENGQTVKIQYETINSKKHGYYQEYFKNGRLKKAIEYNKGKKSDFEAEFNENQTLKTLRSYTAGGREYTGVLSNEKGGSVILDKVEFLSKNKKEYDIAKVIDGNFISFNKLSKISISSYDKDHISYIECKKNKCVKLTISRHKNGAVKTVSFLAKIKKSINTIGYAIYEPTGDLIVSTLKNCKSELESMPRLYNILIINNLEDKIFETKKPGNHSS